MTQAPQLIAKVNQALSQASLPESASIASGQAINLSESTIHTVLPIIDKAKTAAIQTGDTESLSVIYKGSSIEPALFDQYLRWSDQGIIEAYDLAVVNNNQASLDFFHQNFPEVLVQMAQKELVQNPARPLLAISAAPVLFSKTRQSVEFFDSLSPDTQTAMIASLVKQGCTTQLSSMRDLGINIACVAEHKTFNGRNIFHLAANACPELIDFLFSTLAKKVITRLITEETNTGQSPIRAMAENSNAYGLNRMLAVLPKSKLYAELKKTNSVGLNVLHIACYSGDAECIKTVLAACTAKQRETLIRIKSGKNEEYYDLDRSTPLIQACSNHKGNAASKIEAILSFFSESAESLLSIKTSNQSGTTPILNLAADHCQAGFEVIVATCPAAIKTLLSQRNRYGQNVLHRASEYLYAQNFIDYLTNLVEKAGLSSTLLQQRSSDGLPTDIAIRGRKLETARKLMKLAEQHPQILDSILLSKGSENKTPLASLATDKSPDSVALATDINAPTQAALSRNLWHRCARKLGIVNHSVNTQAVLEAARIGNNQFVRESFELCTDPKEKSALLFQSRLTGNISVTVRDLFGIALTNNNQELSDFLLSQCANEQEQLRLWTHNGHKEYNVFSFLINNSVAQSIEYVLAHAPKEFLFEKLADFKNLHSHPLTAALFVYGTTQAAYNIAQKMDELGLADSYPSKHEFLSALSYNPTSFGLYVNSHPDFYTEAAKETDFNVNPVAKANLSLIFETDLGYIGEITLYRKLQSIYRKIHAESICETQTLKVLAHSCALLAIELNLTEAEIPLFFEKTLRKSLAFEPTQNGPSWNLRARQKYLETPNIRDQIPNVKDLVEEFTQAVTIPLAFKNGALLESDLNTSVTPELMSRYRLQSALALFADLDIAEIMQLSLLWHTPGRNMPSNLRPYLSFERSWHPLTATKTIDEFDFIPLTSTRDLQNESAALNHCVGYGSYNEPCLNGNTHIISVRNSQGTPLATIEARISDSPAGILSSRLNKDRHLNIVQFYGRNNEKIPTDSAIYNELNQWLESIRSGELKLFGSSGETWASKKRVEESELKNLSAIIQISGYDITDDNIMRCVTYYRGLLFRKENNMPSGRSNRRDRESDPSFARYRSPELKHHFFGPRVELD